MTNLFLGFTRNHEVVFGEVSYREGRFSASFDTSYPMAIGQAETMERIEDYIDCHDAEYILNWLKQYDCKPSELAKELYDDAYNPIEEFFDNSLYTEMFNVDGVEDDIYFLASSCGQHDTREEMGYTINYPL
jgi:hypothetical protein